MSKFLQWLFGVQPAQSTQPAQPAQTIVNQPDSVVNEGDFHSGPAGYSPNTPYIETQYGSGFDEEADWADHEY